MQHPLGAARRDLARLCQPCRASARFRFRARRCRIEPSFDLRPFFNRGCRLRESDAVVLIPEGILKLSPGGLRVLRLCDGERSVSMILEELKAGHPGELSKKIEAETLAFLGRLIE